MRRKKKREIKFSFLPDFRPEEEPKYELFLKRIEELIEEKGVLVLLAGDIIQGIPKKTTKAKIRKTTSYER